MTLLLAFARLSARSAEDESAKKTKIGCAHTAHMSHQINMLRHDKFSAERSWRAHCEPASSLVADPGWETCRSGVWAGSGDPRPTTWGVWVGSGDPRPTTWGV